jgi:uncharacterized membrane-anchored protein YhcB (DUF1043 family)
MVGRWFFFFDDQVVPLKHNFNASSAAVKTVASYQNLYRHSFSARMASYMQPPKAPSGKIKVVDFVIFYLE